MFRKIKDLRIEKFFDMEIDMNLCDVKLKERLVEIFNKVNIDVVSFYENNAKYYNNPIFEGTELKKQKDRLERLIEEIATEKKNFASSEKVKFNIGDTVTLKYTEGLGHSPFISMHRAYEIINLDNKRARISDDKISIVVPLEALEKIKEPSDELKFKIDIIIDESFMEKLKEEKEEITIIRKLEDFDGFPNGMGLKLRVDRQNEEIDIMYGVSVASSVLFKESCFKVLKAMGFKFEYKPLRTKEEIEKEIEEISKPFSDIFYCVIGKKDGKYIDIGVENDSLPKRKYLTVYAAKELAKELNEILENE